MPSLAAVNAEGAFYLEQELAKAKRKLAEVERERDDLKAAFCCSIAVERMRHIKVEGWTPEHDDAHSKGEMAMAALSYIFHAIFPHVEGRVGPMRWWPWGKSWWKPSDDPIRDLEKAGALIAAEIDRRLRLRPEVPE